MKQAAEKLTAETAQLRKSVDKLAESIDSHDERLTRNERSTTIMTVCLVLLAALVAGMVGLGVWVAKTSARVDAVCGLYSVILGAYNPDTRAPGPDRAAYEAAFAELRRQYTDDMRCETPLVPPRSEGQDAPR